MTCPVINNTMQEELPSIPMICVEKIIRIRVKEDGTYEIPDGNLFPKDQPKTRPEIYVMGTEILIVFQ